MTTAPDLKSLGAIGLSAELFRECQASLRDVGTLRSLADAPLARGARGEPLDAILFGLSDPLEQSVSGFCQSRREHPLVPILALGAGVDADLATELVKCGAEDFMLLPASPEALCHKVRRALGEAVGPAFDRPELAAFQSAPPDENQRHCFRVSVSPEYPVLSTLPGPVERPFEVKDLSIATDQAPGGLQLSAARELARRLPFDQWERRSDIEIVVHLPKGSPITTRARLIPGLRNGPDGSVRFAVEYWVTRPADKQRFHRYWVDAQRRMRRRAR